MELKPGEDVQEVVDLEAAHDRVREILGEPVEGALGAELLVELAVVAGEIRLEVVVDDEASVGVAEGALGAVLEVGERAGARPGTARR